MTTAIKHGYTVPVEEVARLLHIWPQSVRFLINEGTFRAIWSPDGTKWLVHSEDVENYQRKRGGRKSDGLRGVKVPEGTDRTGKYTTTPKLRELIRLYGGTIQGFADDLGVDVSMFYMIEKGKRSASAEFRVKTAELLDAPESELFRRIEAATP